MSGKGVLSGITANNNKNLMEILISSVEVIYLTKKFQNSQIFYISSWK